MLNLLEGVNFVFIVKFSIFTEEFVAHSSMVNCLSLGHKSGRVMVTGGDDKKVNLWAVGKQNCIMVRCYVYLKNEFKMKIQNRENSILNVCFFGRIQIDLQLLQNCRGI